MAIPSLGGSGDNSMNKIHVNNISEIKSSQSTEQPLPIQEPQEHVAVEQKEGKKEYSIEQFRNDYEEMVVKRILPELHQYEGERKKRLVGAVISAIVFGALAIYVFLFVDGKGSGDLFWGLIAAATGVWFWLK